MRQRRELDEALRAWEDHSTACGTCTPPGGRWYDKGGRLRQAYVSAWLERFGATQRDGQNANSRSGLIE